LCGGVEYCTLNLINKTMDNFLTLLYFEKFTLSKREKELMENNVYPDTKEGEHADIRNDQSISEVRQQQQMLTRLITEYLNKLKSE
jgi:hypothetical protein